MAGERGPGANPDQQSGKPKPEQKPEAAGKDNSGGRGVLKSKRTKEIKPDGTIILHDEEYYPSGDAMVEKSATEKAPTAEKSGEQDKAKTDEPKKDSGESKKEEPKKPEAPEAGKEKAVTGAAVVEAIKTDPETPKEVKKALENPEKAKQVAEKVEKTSVFGDNVKRFFRTFVPGFFIGASPMGRQGAEIVAKAAIKFVAKRTLDVSTVGLGAIAGGLAGGSIELIKSSWKERQRLHSLDTYKAALAGYDDMTDLEKVTAIIAIEQKLKEKFSDRTIEDVNEQEALQALKRDLRTRLEKATGQSSDLPKDKEQIEKLLRMRGHEEVKPKGEKGKIAQSWEISVNFIKKALEIKNKKDKKEKFEALCDLIKTHSGVEAELLKQGSSPETRKLLEQFYKERGLVANKKKIAINTLKGVVFGAAGGAAGAYIFEHFIGSPGQFERVDSFSAENPAAAAAAHAQEAAHAAAGNVINVPGAPDVQYMHNTVWQTVREFMVNQGHVANPSNHDINEAVLAIAKANGLEIQAHHLADPNHAGHVEEAIRKFLDTKMQQGVELHGFASAPVKNIIEHAGGHFDTVEQIVPHVPGSEAVKAGTDFLNAHGPQQVAEYLANKQAEIDQNNLIKRLVGFVVVGGVGGAILWQKRNRNKEYNASHIVADFSGLPKELLAGKPVELMGGDLEGATMEKRLEVLAEIRTEVMRRIDAAARHLKGDSPNLEAFEEEVGNITPLISQDQVRVLAKGASDEDAAKLDEEMYKLTEEVQGQLAPLRNKAEQIKQSQAKRTTQTESGDETEQAAPADDDGDSIEDEATKAKPSEAVPAPEEAVDAKPGWTESFQEGKNRVGTAVKRAEQALSQNKVAEAETYLLEALSVLLSLGVQSDQLPAKEKKFAKKQIETLKKPTEGLSAKIETAKKVQPKKETPGKKERQERIDEAARLGLNGWELSYFNRMMRLKLITPQAEGSMEKGSGNQNRERLEKFILLTDEKKNIFNNLTPSGAKDLRRDFLVSLEELKEGKPEKLKKVCLRIMKRGKDLHKEDQATTILANMGAIATELNTVIGQAKLEFFLANTK